MLTAHAVSWYPQDQEVLAAIFALETVHGLDASPGLLDRSLRESIRRRPTRYPQIDGGLVPGRLNQVTTMLLCRQTELSVRI